MCVRQTERCPCRTRCGSFWFSCGFVLFSVTVNRILESFSPFPFYSVLLDIVFQLYVFFFFCVVMNGSIMREKMCHRYAVQSQREEWWIFR